MSKLKEGFAELDVNQIVYNEFNPRITMDDASIVDLAQSISEAGLIEPIVVRRRTDGKYEIITGTRRYTACKKAGLTKIPARIMDVDDATARIMCLTENVQREDLNPIERAIGLQDIIDTSTKSGKEFTRDQLGAMLGKTRHWVEHHLSLLKLPKRIQDLVASRTLDYGTAIYLNALETIDEETRTKEMEQVLHPFWDEDEQRYVIPLDGRKRIREKIHAINEAHKLERKELAERIKEQQDKFEDAEAKLLADKEKALELLTSTLSEETMALEDEKLKELVFKHGAIEAQEVKDELGNIVEWRYDERSILRGYEERHHIDIATKIKEYEHKEDRELARRLYSNLALCEAIGKDLKTAKLYLTGVTDIQEEQRKIVEWRSRIESRQDLIRRMVEEGVKRCVHCDASLERKYLENRIAEYESMINELLQRSKEIADEIEDLGKQEKGLARKIEEYRLEWDKMEEQKRLMRLREEGEGVGD